MRSTASLKNSEERENNLIELNLMSLQCQQLLVKCQILELTNLSESEKAQNTKIAKELEAKIALLEKMKGKLAEEEKQFQSALVESLIPEMEAARGTKYTENETPLVRQYLHDNIEDAIHYFKKCEEVASMDEEYINDYSYIIKSTKYYLVRGAELFLIKQVPNYSVSASYRAYEQNMMNAAFGVFAGKNENELTKEDVNAVLTSVEKISNNLMTLFSQRQQPAEEPDAVKRISPPGPGRKQDH